MQKRLTILAALFYLAVIFYHPLVILGHMGMHTFQVDVHQNVHNHTHHNHDGDTTLFHIHGETDTENSDVNLVQLVFQCIPPLLVDAPTGFKLISVHNFKFSHSYFAYYPYRHTPPPEVLLT